MGRTAPALPSLGLADHEFHGQDVHVGVFVHLVESHFAPNSLGQADGPWLEGFDPNGARLASHFFDSSHSKGGLPWLKRSQSRAFLVMRIGTPVPNVHFERRAS